MSHALPRLRLILFPALLAGCVSVGAPTDPLEDVERLSDVAVAEGEAAPLAATDDAPANLFAGLFSRPAASPGSAETSAAPGDVPPLTLQPFGAVGRTCGLATGDMGSRIAAASGFTVHDTAPGSTAPRPHYITGFSDGCARQFTAALVLTGDVGTHEVVRYQTAQSRRPYTDADTAYEAIKAGVCRAGHGQPCGAQIDRLARNTVFITGYEQFASSPVWVEILLHAGDVAAVSVERE